VDRGVTKKHLYTVSKKAGGMVGRVFGGPCYLPSSRTTSPEVAGGDLGG